MMTRKGRQETDGMATYALAKAIVASAVILCATAMLITKIVVYNSDYYQDCDIQTYHSDPDNM
jgi:hypothetical protein